MKWERAGNRATHKVLLAIVVLIAASLMEPASGEQTSGTIGVHATVPVICRATTEAAFSAPLRPGNNDLGHADLYCNAYRGYRLTLQHTSVPPGTRLFVDGRPISVTAGATETPLEEGDQPLYHQRRHLALMLPDKAAASHDMRLVIAPRN